MKTLSKRDIEGIHAFLAREFGGDAGSRDRAVLEQLLLQVGTHTEEGVLGYATKLMEEIANQAPFKEGNTRTAFFVADVFLRINGFYLRCDNVLTEKYFSALLAEQRFTYEFLLPWVKTKAVKL